MPLGTERSERPYLSRAEAFPIARYRELTQDQRNGLRQLLRRLKVAIDDLERHQETPVVPNWLTNERFARLAFVDGQRGTGKTTLMATLVRLIVPDPNSTYFDDFHRRVPQSDIEQEEETIPLNEDLRRLASPLHDRIVVLEPLDMEPLPRSTPLLAAILARLSRAARDFEIGTRKPQGLLDPDLDDDRDFIRFQQFQAQIARALDSNLADRRGSLDREQYGQAVMEQEQDRLRIWSTLDDVLKHLSMAIGGSGTKGGRHLFLVPVDDVDLNPTRCLELLRLLRSYSPPQLYFLLMGQFDLVKSVVNLSMANEYYQVRPVKSDHHVPLDESLERKIAEVAAANLQKMVPDVIKLPVLSIDEVLEFRPPGLGTKARTLGDLFELVKFENKKVLPDSVTDLRSLLEFGRERSPSRNQNRPGVQSGDYPGIGAFQVSLRRLVDLYRQLDESLREEEHNLSQGSTSYDPILDIFRQYWNRIVDEDPHLNPESRERLQREGFTACEVITSSDEMFCRDYMINDTLVKSNETDKNQSVTYQPVISIADRELNESIPRLRVSRSTTRDGESTIVQDRIFEPRTRCAYVLLHDIHVARMKTDQEELFNPIRVSSPVCMVWKSESGKEVRIPWPLPHLQSFARLTALTGEFYESLTELLSDLSEVFQAITPTQLEELVRTWILLGQKAILARPQTELRGYSKWGDIVAWVVQCMQNNTVVQRRWCLQLVMLTAPETCAIDLAAKKRNLRGLPKKHKNAIRKLESYTNDYLQELKGRRSQRFDLLWTDEFRDLWILLNNRFSDESWINLKLREPTRRTRNEFQIALDEFRKEFRIEFDEFRMEFSENLEDKLTSESKKAETSLAFEMELNSIRGLIQQGTSLMSSNVQSACSLLSQVLSQAERLYSQRVHDLKVAYAVIDAAEQLGIAYIELMSPTQSFEQYLRAENVILELIEEGHDSQELKQRRIELIISRSYPLFLPHREFHFREDIENAITECLEELSSNPNDVGWSRLFADAQTIKGLILRDSGLYEQAGYVLRSAIDVFDSIDTEDKEAGEFSLEWANYYLASVYKRNGELKIAKEITERERTNARIRSSQHVEDSEVQQLYLVTTRLLGQILLYQGEIADTIDLFTEAEAIADRDHLRNTTSLLRTRDLARSRIELAHVLRLLGSQNKTTNPVTDALKLLRQAIPELERIDSIGHNSAQAALDLGTGYLELSRIFSIMDDKKNIRENLDKANEALNRAIEVEPFTAPVYLKMAELHWESFKHATNSKQRRAHRINTQNCLEAASRNNVYFYPEIQEIERELHESSKMDQKSPRSKDNNQGS